MRCAVLTYIIHHIFIDSSNVWHMLTLLLQLWLGTGYIVAGFGYFWAITLLVVYYHPITAKDYSAVRPDWTTFHCEYKV